MMGQLDPVWWIRRFVGCLLCLMAAGCGGGSNDTLAPVVGRVTLNGEPLQLASIRFVPEGTGRASFAVTDDRGEYAMAYTYDKQGALIGKHQVCINSKDHHDESPRDPLLPAAYNTKTRLTATVAPGKNEIDFELKSSVGKAGGG